MARRERRGSTGPASGGQAARVEGHLRPGRPGDARAVAEVHVAGWRQGYRELFPRAYLDALDVGERERRWARVLEDAHGDAEEGAGGSPARVLVHVDDDGRVDGFATSGSTRDEDLPAGTGEVFGLYVHPGAWGGGVGGSLLGAAAAALGAQPPPALWTLQGNRRARGFYAHRGWVEDGAVRRDERPPIGQVPGIAFHEVRYRLRRALATPRADLDLRGAGPGCATLPR